VVLNGLPQTGNWILTLSPGNLTTNGIGVTKTILGLASGMYSFTVTNQAGCTSVPSASVVINEFAGPPVVVINDPAPVCFPSTVNLTLPAVTAGSALNLVYTYWTDAASTKPFSTPGAAPAGTYYIKGTNANGDFTIKPVLVSVYKIPVATAGPDQVAGSSSTIKMNAHLANSYESGIWSVVSGNAEIFDSTSAITEVSGLSMGENIFAWRVTNKACATTSDTVLINVSDLIIPTLITPNMDGKNDYFILKESQAPGKMELIIFDRRGVEVYKNTDYDNSWNGVDYTGKVLMDDTYFYVLRTDRGTSKSGYIVIRR
jgi:gliding motility-associated-like protein